MTAPAAAYDITNLVGRSGNIMNLLTWTAPSDAGVSQFIHTHIRFATDAPPSDQSSGTFVANVSGSNSVYAVHNNLENGVSYYYSLFTVYEIIPGSPIYYGPYSIGPLTPASSSQIFTRLKASFTKLEHNTKLYSASQKYYTTNLIIWLSDGQASRKTSITQALDAIKPAHTSLCIFWEPYYIAQTTSEQLASASFDGSVYSVSNGTLINVVPTIDGSFGGDISL